ncbi:uncharacterized protein LOC111277165 [Durio zibethinus]|uniref:Uncharacterized protein LOC111277165 n=1 Tax=Durio zibethinus TaxID=66656 RepID=A0A6P5WTV7_DURZI|nr:uncharacterized protein LOC111277165 [Durio zibethinus]
MKPVRRDSLQRADHIFTPCSGGIYYHHGIYVGKATVTNPKNNGEEQEIYDAVIHFLGFYKKSSCKPQCKRCFYTSQNMGVIITCLDCFLDGSLVYVYEYGVSYLTFNFKSNGSCSYWDSYPPDKVIRTAYCFLDKQSFGDYHLVFNNCESFATYCKTGNAMSNQALFGSGLPGAAAYIIAKGILWGN